MRDDTAACFPTPLALGTSSGTSRYYSPQNPHTGYYFNKYIPDAHGYPFNTTVYTADNTSRISRQGGVGPEFQPGSGHETRYFYGKPDQVELDRLFGSEAGNAQHYIKNMTLDANGQVNVTYYDAHGRTIATALAGNKPDNLFALPSAEDPGAITQVTKQLVNPENTTRDAAAFTVTSSSTLLIPLKGTYHFEYTYDPVSVLTASCVQDICSDCYYDLTITIKDECGQPLYEKTVPASLTEMDTTCGNTAAVVKGDFDLEIPIGEYQVTYQLFASKAAADFYEETFLRQNTCIKTLNDFKRQFIADIDYSGCYAECTTCREALKDRAYFVNQFIELLISEDMTPIESDRVFANSLYDSLYNACLQRCNNSYVTPCQDKYDLLILDVTPGGQYALYEQVVLDDENNTEEILVDKPVNVFTDYKDENGNADQVENANGETVSPQQLTLREFIRQFKPSWAASLVKFHPEYCYYKWCQLTTASKVFDETVQNVVEKAAEAADSAWWNPSDPLALLKKDPFFTNGGAGVGRYTEMANKLNNFSATLQASPESGPANILQVVNFMIYCANDTTRTSLSYTSCIPPATCFDGRDENLEWELYKTFYLQVKAPIVAAVRKTNADPVIRDCKNCYIGTSQFECDPATNPDCGVLQNAGTVTGNCPLPNSDPTKPYYAKKVRQFMEDMDGSALLSSFTSKDMASLRDSLDQQINGRVAAECKSNCESQADNWMASLMGCNNLINGTDSTKYKLLRAGLVAVCMGGCDAAHPYGASTVAPDNSNQDKSFEDVIKRVLGAAAINDSCTALLISDPKPYDQDPNMLPPGEDDCTCAKIKSLKEDFEQAGGGGSFLNYLKRRFAPTLRLTQSQLDVLMKKCDSTVCVTPSEMRFAIPDALSCRSCVDCETLRTHVNTFRQDHPQLDTTSARYEILLTNYLNQQLHFNLVYHEYWSFMQDRCYTQNDKYQPGVEQVTCYAFGKAFKHFLQLKPKSYVNQNGDPNASERFKQDFATWMNLELGISLNYNDYESIANRCGDTIPVPANIPLGDSVYTCHPSVLDCCTLEENVNEFRAIYPEGINARLLAYYFEMQKHIWCTPIGLPDVKYNADYQELKNYFLNNFELPREVFIDMTTAGTTYTINGTIDCGIDYDFGKADPEGGSIQYKLCNRPVIIEYEIDSTSCMRSQFQLSLANAAGAYQQYMDSVRREFREIYLSRCLSVQPRLAMSGDLYEYHYTLFYYDQGGNLVKTVPPAGVRLLTDEEIATVQTDRPYNSPECYKIADMLGFWGGTINFGSLLNGRQNYTFEQWISTDYFDGLGLFTNATDVTAPEKYIDSTRTIPAFKGRKGINCYAWGGYLKIETGEQPAYLADTLYLTKTYTSRASLASVMTTGKWVHLVIMKTGNTSSPFEVYVNGRVVPMDVSSRVDTLGGPLTETGSSDLLLARGKADEYDPNFWGLMKQFRFYNRPLLYKEIVANTSNECLLPSDERGLEIWMPMNDGQGETVNDRMANRDYTLSNFDNEFYWMGDHIAVYPLHMQPSNYTYNSLQGMITKTTPDAGTHHVWYDRLGRVAASRSAEQENPLNGGTVNRFNYSKYDALGRAIEVGEKTGAADVALLESLDDTQLQNWMSSGANTQITRTKYDEPLPGLAIVQENLRKRVASLSLDENGDGVYEIASHYSYDVSGNAKTFWQDIPALEAVAAGQGMKQIEYDYDLISGKVNKLFYQPGKKDQFIYRYLFDAENRLSSVATSRDSLIWQQDATYSYYLHGLLARTELGENKVQGIDLAHTLHGWTKGINSFIPDVSKDMGADGKAGSPSGLVARDVLGYTIGYYENDYTPIGGDTATAFRTNYNYPAPLATGNGLYNGNISNTTVALSKINNASPVGYTYSYDQLNRLISMQQHSIGSQWTPTDNYREAISYDANGNILSYLRNGTLQGGTQQEMDNLTYEYTEGSNQLRHIKDQVNSENYSNDLDSQPDDNYTYDRIGNMISDNQGGISKIDWTIYGKIKSIAKSNGTISFAYDPVGNRVWKEANGKKTFYIRDPQGNVLAVYENASGKLTWAEQHLYGAGRLGMWEPGLLSTAEVTPESDSIRWGHRSYELVNHLGNVLSTITDKKTGVSSDNLTVDYYTANVQSQQDYYPFGMLQPGRKYTLGNNYRYGFNGKENDDEVKGDGNQQDYGMRIYDPRIGKFLSVDPLTSQYPELTPYQFASNTPVAATDLDGAEGKLKTIYHGTNEQILRQNEVNMLLLPKSIDIEVHKYMEYDKQGNRIFDARTEVRVVFTEPILVGKNKAGIIQSTPNITLVREHVSPDVGYAKNDNSNPDDNLADAAAGNPAKTSEYGHAKGKEVYLSDALLDGLAALSKEYSFRITELTGGKHSAITRHYIGVAVDIDEINGVHVTASNPYFKELMARAKELGATEVVGPGSPNHGTHVHLGWPRSEEGKSESNPNRPTTSAAPPAAKKASTTRTPEATMTFSTDNASRPASATGTTSTTSTSSTNSSNSSNSGNHSGRRRRANN
jgi:RHS repeat-associated protein